MEQIIIGTVMVITGIAVILCKERIVNEVINLNNNEGFGFTHYGNQEKKRGLWYLPLFGGILILMGLLTFFGVIK